MMHDLLSYISNHNNIGIIVRIVCASYVVGVGAKMHCSLFISHRTTQENSQL